VRGTGLATLLLPKLPPAPTTLKLQARLLLLLLLMSLLPTPSLLLLLLLMSLLPTPSLLLLLLLLSERRSSSPEAAAADAPAAVVLPGPCVMGSSV
jgi:hypothetical protein